MSLLEEISAITIRHHARRIKPHLTRRHGLWVCYSDFPMRPVVTYGRTIIDAFEAWVRDYPDLLLPLGPMHGR